MKEQITIIRDDLDNTEPAEEVPFALDGRSYTIDLAPHNQRALRAGLEPFIGRATEIGRPPKQRSKAADTGKRPPRQLATVPMSTELTREERAAIRDWARANGYTLGDRGRIAAEVIEAYHTSARSR